MSMSQRIVKDGQSAVKRVDMLDFCAKMRIVLQSDLIYLFSRDLKTGTKESSHSPGGCCVQRAPSPRTALRMATEGYCDRRTPSHTDVPDTIGASTPLPTKTTQGVR